MRFLPPLVLIDDNRDVLDLYEDVANGLGVNSIAYANARFYLNDKAQASGDQLLILDLCMPDTDGFEVIRFLKNAAAKPDLILISGYDEVIIESAKKLASAYGLNVVDVLLKPVDLQRLENLIRQRLPSSINPIEAKKSSGN